ncbi:L,D-transpeptidase family protein [Bradyrhizobium sp. CB3481]|uniref:L,D-transpeptidase family protein n=1 Tax=Bradyrhizobium sp. CB3481 TaxID=3039158 RepID=UPI0024B13645|nr:L,D-transpeptidase family protein [Bradyrhizobium sp. CB3481]WFU13969.1 L,D-transpeptidase family protein [Bradyrhizobium sp. CB3481]
MRVNGHRFFSASSAGATISKQRFGQIAILTAAGSIAAVSQADAATMFYWQDSDPGYYRPMPPVQPRKPKVRRPAAKSAAAVKETNAKPQGPLIIAISIEQQKLRIYDAKGLFAESPVSTGMKGHSTPMGVFSVIQKHKMHRSNIYSGAPMPYMQRITWSGVALHAGVLPGYPASHGCIRMPMAFAVKMWNWTRMGARVIITPGQITPANFAHPLLVAQKVVPQPLLADDPTNDAPAVKGDKGADAGGAIKAANSEAGLDLRPTVGHAAPLREQTHTADASSALPATNAVVSDASLAKVQGGDLSKAEAKAGTAKSEPAANAGGTSETAKTEVSASEGMKAEASAETKSDEAPAAAIANAPKTEEAKAPEAKTPEAKTEAKTPEAKPAESKVAEPAKASAGAPPAPTAASDVKKDTARLPGAEKPAKAEAPRRAGQIAVFVSRKDSKLYVRENFKPQFEVPVTIAASDRPLGTHVFTADTDKADPNLLRWSVVSLPLTARSAAHTEEDGRAAGRKKASAAEAKPSVPNSPAEALDRISVAPEAMARIAEVLSTGSSIIVSDLGVNQGGETGEGTDFIVPLR